MTTIISPRKDVPYMEPLCIPWRFYVSILSALPSFALFLLAFGYPLASHHMFYAIPKHCVILIRNRTKEGLNTISFHGLMPDTYQCFHQLSVRLPWNGYTLWSCLAAEFGSSFSVSGNNNWQVTEDRYQHQMRQQWQNCYHSICRQYCLCHQFDNRMCLFLFSLELHLIPMEVCQCDPFSLYLLPDVLLNCAYQEVQY